MDCFGKPLLCHSCCLAAHSSLPFHSIEKWTGEFFKKTSLNTEGFVLRLGHGGLDCPENIVPSAESEAHEDGEHGVVGEVLLETWEPRDKRALVVVDVSGVHQLVVSWCCCQGAPDHGVQLFEHDLFPASTIKPSTAFTFAVLKYFHVDAVECKTSASNFFNKLRRLTEFSNPQSVPVSDDYMAVWEFLNLPKDRYRELMRVSRMWRDLMARVDSGLAHDEMAELQPGCLAIFCPVCPQPGINLPKGWDQDPKRYIAFTPSGNLVLMVTRWLYTRSIVIDGNFSAEHLKMRRPEADISLSPGGRYMVEPKRYELHLSTGKEIKQVCLFRRMNFSSFNAISHRNLCALTTRQSIMSIPPKHTSDLQELVQLHVPDMDAFSPTVLWISRRGKGEWCRSNQHCSLA